MQTFQCDRCGNALFFENMSCLKCGAAAGVVDGQTIITCENVADDTLRPLGETHAGRTFKRCSNAAYQACNWLVDEGGDAYCLACRHNLTVPDLADPKKVSDWRRMEVAKHRLFYALIRLRLPLHTRADHAEGLGFDFLSAEDKADGPVMTGHDLGLITIDLAEADDSERERRRAAMGEPYRTLIGHFRHEVGHWYWDRLARDGGHLDLVRSVFGDDREDYGKALERHYENGPPQDWADDHVSSYATAHAWEDFAETWAHYLHIVDALDTARAFGVNIIEGAGGSGVTIDFDPYAETDFARIASAWGPVTIALNAVNRSMGLPDLYPFVLSATIIEKLSAIHTLVRAGRAAPYPQGAS